MFIFTNCIYSDPVSTIINYISKFEHALLLHPRERHVLTVSLPLLVPLFYVRRSRFTSPTTSKSPLNINGESSFVEPQNALGFFEAIPLKKI